MRAAMHSRSPATEVNRPALQHIIVLDEVQVPVVGHRGIDMGRDDADPVTHSNGLIRGEGEVFVGTEEDTATLD
jgi:hypothetical protein